MAQPRAPLAFLQLVFVLIAALAGIGQGHAAEPQFPALTGRVVDDAHILPTQAVQELTDGLAQHEQATGQQVVVVTLPSLQGYPIEDFGYQLGRHWGIGEKGKNTGALLIVAPAEHKVRIEVGYGLEGQLTDAQCRVIIEQVITPAFRRGDFSGGIRNGTSAILIALGGKPLSQSEPEALQPPSPGPPQLGIFLPFLFPFFVFVIFFMRLLFRGGVYRGGGSNVGFYSDGGGSSGGGFSGGGGSFGGGGASGSW